MYQNVAGPDLYLGELLLRVSLSRSFSGHGD